MMEMYNVRGNSTARDGIPFLAISGVHGAINSLASLSNSIEIRMRAVNSIQVSVDKISALI